MKVLRLDEKNLFNVKVQDRIDKDDIFYEDVLVPGAQQLNMILKNCYIAPNEKPKDFETKENPNNILAFIGDRGQGKTSTMLTFETQLLKCESSLFGSEIEGYCFESLGIIDPSTFENGSNLLEVILGRMYKRFLERCEMKFGSGEQQKNTREIRNELISLFKKTYNYLSIINDKKTIAPESIFEQSLDNLWLLGDSTNLKKILLNLINEYLKLMRDNNDKKKFLVITIDDIDLDVSHSFEIVEQIRKYLIVPNVVILMSVKIEQLHRGIRCEYSKYLKDAEDDDAYEMATTYLRKMIPESRRLFLPNLRSDVSDLFLSKQIRDNDSSATLFLNDYVVELLYKKTGIYLINFGNKKRFLLSGNLREFVELISFLNENLENPENAKNIKDKHSIYLNNLTKFREFFVFNWCSTNLSTEEYHYIVEIERYSLFLKNRKIIKLLRNVLVRNAVIDAKDINHLFKIKGRKDEMYAISDVQNILTIFQNNDHRIGLKNNGKFIYSIQIFYTILLHQLMNIDALNELQSENPIAISSRDINTVSKQIGGKVRDYKLHKELKSKEDFKGRMIYPAHFTVNDGEAIGAIDLLFILLTKKIDVERDVVLYSYDSWLNDDYMLDFNDLFFRGLDLNYSAKLYYHISNVDGFEAVIKSRVYKEYGECIRNVSEFILCNYDVYSFYYEWMGMHYIETNIADRMIEMIMWNIEFLTNLDKSIEKFFNYEFMSKIRIDIQKYLRFLGDARDELERNEYFKKLLLAEM